MVLERSWSFSVESATQRNIKIGSELEIAQGLIGLSETLRLDSWKPIHPQTLYFYIFFRNAILNSANKESYFNSSLI